MLFLAMDDYRIAITCAAHVGRKVSGAEVLDLFDWEDSAVIPGDCLWLHVAGRIKIGVNLYIYSFCLWSYISFHGGSPILSLMPLL